MFCYEDLSVSEDGFGIFARLEEVTWFLDDGYLLRRGGRWDNPGGPVHKFIFKRTFRRL